RPADVAGMLDTLSLPWLLLAFSIVAPQLLLSAWRWRITAGFLGIALPFRHALREYCLGNLLNQILPGGVAGDVSRAWRHARNTDSSREAWHAVLIERAAGQGVLLASALLALPFSPEIRYAVRSALANGSSVGVVAVAATLLAAALIARRFAPALRRLAGDFARSVLARAALLRQLALSLALLGSYVAVYLCCARALGVDTPALTLMPLVFWVLVAMALPLSLAGWGVREGAAAALWLLAGMPAAEGVAISLLYGTVVLLSALAAACLLLAAGRSGKPGSAGAG
ncbi:MAG: lysylphosphatidylglycerol synthase transmembrane domain-containing protein, partial [Gammaproteobacteria bacterium]